MNRRQFLGCAGCAGIVAIVGCTMSRPPGKKGASISADQMAARPENFSYCGIDCKACDVFKATVYGDQQARTRAAKLFAKTAREHWGMETLDPMILDCRGCRVAGEQHKGYGRCPIRPCAQKRDLSSCALCPQWQKCDLLSGVLADEPQAKINLRKIAEFSNQDFDHQR